MVFKFASDVNVDQTTEITRMQRMLFMRCRYPEGALRDRALSNVCLLHFLPS